MQTDLSSVEQVILFVFCGFIVAINLSLVFAFVHRNRDRSNGVKSPFSGTRKPWQSRYEDESAELTRRVDELRKNAPHSGEPGSSTQDHQNRP